MKPCLILLLGLFLNTSIAYAATTNQYRTITNDSMLYKIVTEEIIDFSIENSGFFACMKRLSEQTKIRLLVVGLGGKEPDKKISIRLDNVTLDCLIRIICLYYKLDYAVAPYAVVIRPLGDYQCDMLERRSYHIPKSHVINPEALNIVPLDGVRRSIDYHKITYTDNEEELLVQTCVPQAYFIEAWLKATVPDFDKLQNLHKRVEPTPLKADYTSQTNKAESTHP